MIKKLRRKFILINMALVSLVLLIAFAAIYISNYQQLQTQTHEALLHTLDHKKPPPKNEMGRLLHEPKPFEFTPILSVMLDQNNNIVDKSEQNMSISENNLTKAVKEAMASRYDEGILPDLNLRFLRRATHDGTTIAFADRNNEIDSMRSLFLTFLVVGAGGLMAFFLISLFLSSWALRPAEKAWEQQRQFVADASHELKMPLTVILANIGILLVHREDTIARQFKWVENTQVEANRMKKLVNDLLFLAKSGAPQLPLIYSELNLSDTVWGCLLPMEAVAFEQGITINTNIEPDITVKGDSNQLKQLVTILLDNACKYAGEKGIVTVTVVQGQKKVLLKVNNTGTPIPAIDLPHIFDRFYRAEKSRARKLGGYGLGLAIAKSIVENHHGKISAESTINQGTTFTVLF